VRHTRVLVLRTFATLVAVALLVQQPERAVTAQESNALDSRRITLTATTQVAVTESNSLIARMLQARELTSVRIQDDPQIPSRQIQTLQQVYKGIPVEGGSVTLHKAGPATISVFGTLFSDIAVDITPAIAPVDAARLIEKAADAFIPFGASPTLVIVPSPVGTFALTYKATVAYAITCYVDAFTGDVVRVVDEKHYDTGLGTGTLGEPKKMATTVIGGTYRTRDTLRPAGISTYDTGGSSTALDRMLNSNNVTDNDLASNATNTWTNGYVVDAHSNTGLTYDYFFRQHNWSGLDGSNRPLSDIVHSGTETRNNAFFIASPFGPNRNGAIVYGRTAGGVPVTALDIAGHELMHGVTFFSLNNRTGSGFVPIVYAVLGPTSFVYNGSTLPCSTTVLADSQGNRRPFLCSNGRYVLGASHGGAINEAVSDVFGTSVEFFYQPGGSGPLRADYLIGEDITGFGPIRSLSNPASIPIRHEFGTMGYPDHLSKMLNYALVVTGGTATNPTSVSFSPVAFSDGNFVSFVGGSTDGGGVPLHSTLFSPAFYLAVEGGRNATSNLSVTGVGAANRAQIEKVFFRAMTQLMPNNANLQTAAAAVIQAAIDLYGAGGAPTQAVTQAMVAVGLR
jgi:Zn-dependent metalloprotease